MPIVNLKAVYLESISIIYCAYCGSKIISCVCPNKSLDIQNKCLHLCVFLPQTQKNTFSFFFPKFSLPLVERVSEGRERLESPEGDRGWAFGMDLKINHLINTKIKNSKLC